MAAPHRSRIVRPSSKRLTTWAAINFQTSTHTGSGGTILGSLNAAALALRPFTVVRTYLSYQITSDQAAAAELQAGAIGMCVVSDQAAAIGATAVPTPVVDLGSDLWFLHQAFFGDAIRLTDITTPGSRYEINSKAMRKVQGDQDVVIVVGLSGIGSGFVMLLAGRMLIKVN